ncbi:MAG: hypothetical protein Q9162_004548 [Coniocarpon cinnabarinum]
MVTHLEHLSTESALIDCPRCQTNTRTKVTKERGEAVTLWSVVLCCVTGALLAWVPCVIDACKDTVHRCGQCDLLIATVTSSGVTNVAQGINKPVASQYQSGGAGGGAGAAGTGDAYSGGYGSGYGGGYIGAEIKDAGPAPAYWDYRQDQGYAGGYSGTQPVQEIGDGARMPAVEMEGTSREPVELPGGVEKAERRESDRTDDGKGEGSNKGNAEMNEKTRESQGHIQGEGR